MTEGPGIFGGGAVGTMAIEVYGDLESRVDDGGPSADAYSLFYGRSAAMGWLTPATADTAEGLWGMNDAAVGRGSGLPVSPRVAWFQVVRTGPAPDGVPIQAFVACVDDVLGRLGRLRLEAVQMLLPVEDVSQGQPASPSGMTVAASLLEGSRWFAHRGARTPQPVRVTVDGGPDAAVSELADSVERWLREVRQSQYGDDQRVFACDSVSLEQKDHLVLGPMFAELPEEAVTHHRATVRGTLTEWSLNALGWLAAFLADGWRRNGARGPLRLAAERAG